MQNILSVTANSDGKIDSSDANAILMLQQLMIKHVHGK